MQPPKEDELKGNPIKLWTEKDKSDYYKEFLYDFNKRAQQVPTYGQEPPDDINMLFREQAAQLEIACIEVKEIDDQKAYDSHTDLVHDYFRNPQLLQNYFICKNKAFLKMSEIYDVVFQDVFDKKDIRSFHLCEGPGYFIEATYLAWLRHETATGNPVKWEWNANTLNPYFENISCVNKLIDDSHIRGHMEKWFFGDSDNGDILEITEDYLIRNNLAGSFDLVTADGSKDDPTYVIDKETLVHDILENEVRLALKLLRHKGTLILKTYLFCHEPTRAVMMLLAENFEEMVAIKPAASRAGSSEKYIVCSGFGGRMDLHPRQLLDCDEFFLRKQVRRIERHVRTFNDGQLAPYTWNQRKQFMEEQKKRMFTAESASYRTKLHTLFPTDATRDTSPWMSFYGHNLNRRVRDLQDYYGTILNHLNTYDMTPPFLPINIEMMLQYCLCHDVLCVTSTIPLEIKDTLFIEAITFKAMRRCMLGSYIDLFENYSSLTTISDEEWRRHLKVSHGNYTLEMEAEVISIEHVLKTVLEVIDKNGASLTLSNLPQGFPPLWISRLSASVFCLFYAIFEMIEIGPRQIRWTGLKDYRLNRRVVERLLDEMSKFPPETSIRSFIPLHVIDIFHSQICYNNVANLAALFAKAFPGSF